LAGYTRAALLPRYEALLQDIAARVTFL